MECPTITGLRLDSHSLQATRKTQRNESTLAAPLPIIVCLSLFSAACQADGQSVSQQYIESDIERLESAIVECDSIASVRPMPNPDVLDVLRQYEYEDVRVFLITRSAAMAEECQKPQLTDLAYTIGMLEASAVYSEVDDVIANVKPLIYGKETWALKERYFQLPEDMRDELESIPYFQKPFRNIPIIERLESLEGRTNAP